MNEDVKISKTVRCAQIMGIHPDPKEADFQEHTATHGMTFIARELYGKMSKYNGQLGTFLEYVSEDNHTTRVQFNDGGKYCIKEQAQSGTAQNNIFSIFGVHIQTRKQWLYSLQSIWVVCWAFWGCLGAPLTSRLNPLTTLVLQSARKSQSDSSTFFLVKK